MTESRRNFIKKSSLAAAVMSIPTLSYESSLFENETLRVGIIGTGDRGTGLASQILNLEGIEVAAMCEIIPFRLENAKQYGNPKTRYYTDYRQLLDDKKVHAVIIATPFSMHADMAIAALEADKHVYCEKTMTYGFEATKNLLNKARSSKKIFQTGHQYHSSRLYHHVAELIKKDYLGELTLIKSQWNRNGDWRRPVPDPKWEKMINWRMYREYSGGLTAELCSHQIDFANWILGDHPVRVSGFGGIDYWKDGRETYDNVHILTEYANGVKASYTSLTTNSKDNYQIQILGKKGSIVINKDQAWSYKENTGDDKELGVVDGVSSATVDAWSVGRGAAINVSHKNPSVQALLDFRESVLKNRQPLSNVETGAQVSIVVQMALNAMNNNSVEHWKEAYNF